MLPDVDKFSVGEIGVGFCTSVETGSGVQRFCCQTRSAGNTFDSRLFDTNWLAANDMLLDSNNEGRGSVRFFQHHDLQLVLKQYRRGGYAARVSDDQYIWTGQHRTRCQREFELLHILDTLSLPAPKPYACLAIKNGFSYRAFLVSFRVQDSQTLSAKLADSRLSEAGWKRIGETIRLFHNASVRHADLNASNILLDKNDGIHLIDFDRGRIDKKFQGYWKRSNLSRLRRSIDKLRVRGRINQFEESDWDSLLSGYNTGL